MKNILKIVLSILAIILSIVCLFTIKNLNMLPNKYFVIFVILMIVVNIIGLLVYTKKKWLNIIGIIFCILTIIISIIGYYPSLTLVEEKMPFKYYKYLFF